MADSKQNEDNQAPINKAVREQAKLERSIASGKATSVKVADDAGNVRTVSVKKGAPKEQRVETNATDPRGRVEFYDEGSAGDYAVPGSTFPAHDPERDEVTAGGRSSSDTSPELLQDAQNKAGSDTAADTVETGASGGSTKTSETSADTSKNAENSGTKGSDSKDSTKSSK